MDIFKILNEKTCVPNFSAKDKTSCLRKLAEIIAVDVYEVDTEEIYEALLHREEMGSTGFEEGVAIPHAKIPGLRDFHIAIAYSKKGVPFDSVDGKKSQFFFVIIGPDEFPEQHLQILAQISRISRNPNARRDMSNARSDLALKEAFLRYVTGSSVSKKDEKTKLLILILYEKRFLDDILELFLELGIRGVNIIESSGIKDQLSNIPLFSDFLNFLGERSDVSKTIMTVVPEKNVTGIVQGVEEIMGDLDKHTGAMVMALDLFFLKGSMEV
ncbi:MAG TPA: PTS sugar transporter subunit IIA [Candidatus Marinimicrobia bacterium]|nr:PTS sugar transporter subunit IIA [Candidatus Neomarinimicrobiota bacterium]